MNLLRRRKTTEKRAASSDDASSSGIPHREKTAPVASAEPVSESDLSQAGIGEVSSLPPTSTVDSKASKPPPPKPKKRKKSGGWSCVDNCCWVIGCICCIWWVLLVLYKCLPTLSEAITGPVADPPGVVLYKEGLRARHPVVFVPGIVTGGLELWEGHPCADGLFRKRLWGGTFGEVYKRPFCWLEHMALDNITGMDPPGVRVRATSGLVAADYFAGGYFVWAVLIQNLARIGYEEKNMQMAAYDWRLSFQNTEVRDKSLSRLKSSVELLVQTNGGNKVVIIPHSMGASYLMHFMKWVEAPLPMGGGGGPDWCAKHLKAVMFIGGTLLGVPKAVSGLFSSEAKDVAVARAIAPGVLDSEIFGMQTLQYIMRVTRTWDSTMSMIPKGGDVIWGGLDWSPEEGYQCTSRRKNGEEKEVDLLEKEKEVDLLEKFDATTKELGPHGKPLAHYGRFISFGKEVAEQPAHQITRKNFRNVKPGVPISANISCGDVWTEYHEISWEHVEAVEDYKSYTADDIPDLLRYVAPQMLSRGDAHFSHGLADNLEDPKYEHFKYWSNPLETRLPNAPNMEIYCMYGVGILTERSYIYKSSPKAETCHIPFRIDPEAHGDSEGCLKQGVQFVDGDETVPTLSAGFMCAKGWRGKTRFNPSGAATFVREYFHAPPANLLEGRGTQSGAHVDIMGNFALIEDILRVAAGASGEDLGGDRFFSDLVKWVERIPLKL